jgi:hypothetical protein
VYVSSSSRAAAAFVVQVDGRQSVCLLFLCTAGAAVFRHCARHQQKGVAAASSPVTELACAHSNVAGCSIQLVPYVLADWISYVTALWLPSVQH